MRILTSLLVTLTLTASGFGWGNGGKSTSLSHVQFAMHDWIALEAFRLAKGDADLDFIQNNLNAFFIGTEAPDLGALPSLHAGTGYRDAIHCHCILFDASEKLTKDWAGKRAQEEFDKAKAALAKGKLKLAAFYAGAMAHYVGDLSQFMHIMGAESHWGSEDQTLRHRYEEVADRDLNLHARTSLIFESFIDKKSMGGTTAHDIAIALAKFVDTGGGGTQTPGEMYKTWKALVKAGKANDPSKWPQEFMDQSGKNIDESTNAVAKLLAMLRQ